MDSVAGSHDQATLVVHTHPLKLSERDIQAVPVGKTLAEMIRDAGYDFLLSAQDENLRVYCGDRRVFKQEFMFYRPGPEEIISVAVVATGGGGGGKNPLNTVLSIALVAVAIMAPYTSPAIAAGMGAGTMGGALLSAGIMVGGSFMINAIAPIQQPKLGSLSGSSNAASSPTYSITGIANRANPFGPIPRVMGTWHNYHPPLAAETYSEQAGDDQYFRMLLMIGYGPVTVSNIRIGETALSNYEGVEYSIRTGLPTDGPLTIYSNDIHEESLAVNLLAGEAVVRTTEPNTDEISVDLSAYQGMFKYDVDGKRLATSVQVLVEYKETGSLSNWAVLTGGTITISDNKNSAFRRSYKATVARGQYDVRVTRVTANATDDKQFDKLAWVTLRSIAHTSPIAFDKLPPVATMELRIKASDQLSGMIDQINMTVAAWADVWTGTAWVSQPTKSPAWWYCDVLCGPATKNAAARDGLDTAAFLAWANMCAANDIEFGAVIDTETVSAELLRDIASVGRASFAYKNNLYSVNFEAPSDNAVMLFSHRNSWNFETTRDYEDFPHALRVQYNDENAGCQQSELIVYADGYTAETAERYESLEIWGAINPTQVAKQARFGMADLALRPERYSLSTWISFLRCQRGDRVKIAHPAILVGQCSGRVTAVTLNIDERVTDITVDTPCDMVAGNAYVVEAQLFSGDVISFPVTTIEGAQTTLTLSEPLQAGLGMDGGEHFSFGPASAVTEDCVITEIVPTSELTASITMRPYVASLYDLDAQEYEATIPVITRPPILQPGVPPLPSILSVLGGEAQAVQTSNGALQQTMWMTWSLPSGGAPVGHFEVNYRINGDSQWWPLAMVQAEARSTSFPADAAYTYDVRIRSVSTLGVPSAWVQSFANQVDTVAPGRPTDLTVRGQVTQNRLSWTNPADLDLAFIEVWVAKDSTLFSAAAKIASVPAGDPGAIQEWGHTAISSTSDHTYWIRATDMSRNVSDFYPAGAEALVTAPSFFGGTINAALAALMDDSNYETVFKVLADAFILAKPGYPDKAIFAVGDVDGVPTLGLAGNAIVDGSIMARMIGAEEIEAEKIAAGAITTGKLAAGAVTGDRIAATSEIALDEGGKLTVGQNNIILDSSSDDMIIAPDNGSVVGAPDLDGVDFCKLSQGNLNFMYWDGTAHQTYNSLKRVEVGLSAQNNVPVTIPGIWKQPPNIIVSPASIMSYNKNYASANQTLVCEASNLTQSGLTYQFTPKAYLRLTEGSVGTAISMPATASGNSKGAWYYANSAARNTPNYTTDLTVSGHVSGSCWASRTNNNNGDITTWTQGVRFYVRAWIYIDGVSTYIGEWTADQVGGVGWSFSKSIEGLTSGIHNYYFRVGFMYSESLDYLFELEASSGSISPTYEATNQSTFTSLSNGTLNYMAIGE
jgi:hypothetical protein